MVEAIRSAYADLHGDYAFVIGHDARRPAARDQEGLGLVVGLAEGSTVISSDLPSILPLTRKIVRVHDGEIVTFWADGVEIHRVSDGAVVEREPEIDHGEHGGSGQGRIPALHAEGDLRAAQAGRRTDPLARREGGHGRDRRPHDERPPPLPGRLRHQLSCVHAGRALHARLASRPAIPILAPQFIAQYGPTLGPEDVGVFVSQSGETKDVLLALEAAQAKGATAFGMVNVIGSTLMIQTERHIPLACGYEISVPATKTFLNQCVAFLYTALRMGGHDTTALHGLARRCWSRRWRRSMRPIATLVQRR